MNALERYVFGPVDAVRPWLLLRGLLLVLAFDCWLDLVPHGGRYGFGGFNVAHFALLDRLLPAPTAGTYVATVLLTGLLAFVMAITRPTRLGVAGVCALYSYGWLMSMLDSYQHHYLLTLLLISATFFPALCSEEVFAGAAPERSRAWGGALFGFALLELVLGVAGVDSPLSALFTDGAAVGTPGWLWAARAGALLLGGLLAFLPDGEGEPKTEASPALSKKRRARKEKRRKGKAPPAAPTPTASKRSDSPAASGPTVSAWAFTSFCVTCAIVYFYTAVTKLSDDWRQGHALRRLSRTDLLDALQERATTVGLPVVGELSAGEFWELLATGAIAVQLITCVGYLIAPARDRLWPSWRPWQRALFVALFLGAPLSFHLAAEAGLGLDIGWFSFYMIFVALVVFAPASVLRTMSFTPTAPARRLRAWLRRADDRRWRALALSSLLLAGALVTLGTSSLDLPGALDVALAASTALAIAGVWALRRRQFERAAAWGAALALGVVLMTSSIARSDVRFDFYRFVGGEYRRHGDYARALAAYEKANAYVVRPYCVYRGVGRRAELVECYAREDRAEAVASRRRDLSVRRRDRARQEAEMRRLLERQAGDAR